MFKTIKDALEFDPRLVDTPKIIGEELAKAAKKIEEELNVHSDSAVAYNGLQFIIKLTVNALSNHTSRYEEAG